MSYTVFARKYRPQTFEEVVAQEHVTRTLKNALARDRITSGYLFTGPRGTGKTTVARILAKAINCVSGPTATPCGECSPCKEITTGSSLDVLEIDAASNTGVDDIRTIRENVRYMPVSGRRRVYIIDEVHRLSGSAFDALLKTLEEPPPHVTFMFATTEPLKVPETILSRTQRFDFRRVSVNDLANHLKTIADKENITIDAAALQLLARKADGSVRDALSRLDQIAAFAGDTITEKDVIEGLGLVDRQLLFDFVEAIATANRKQALELIRQLFEAGVDVADFIAELLEHFRVLMVLGAAGKDTGLLQLGKAELAQYQTQVNHFSIGDILRLMKIVSDTNLDLKSGLDQRLLLEVSAVRMAEMESTVSIDELLSQLKLEPNQNANSAGSDLFPSNSKKKTDLAAGRPLTVIKPAEPTPTVYTRALNLPQLQAGWSDFLSLLRKQSPMLASQLGMAQIREINENEVKVLFGGSGKVSLGLVQKRENLNLILPVLRDHFKANLRLCFELDPSAPPPAHETEKKVKTDPNELLRKSARLRKLVEQVDGEIIGVKKIE